VGSDLPVPARWRRHRLFDTRDRSFAPRRRYDTVTSVQSALPDLQRNLRLLAAVRVALALACGALLLAPSFDAPEAIAVASLLGLTAVASVRLPWPAVSRLQAPIEAVLACLVILAVEPLPEALLPYLLAPALAAGLLEGVRASVTASGLAGLTLLVGREVGEESLNRSEYLSAVSQWTLIPLAVGLLGAWVHRLQQRGAQPEHAAYASAYRLISQLRAVSRQLSGGLDPVSLGQQMLQQLHSQLPFDRGAVYVRSNGGRLTPITFHGADRLDWPTDHPLFDEAWASSAPVRQSPGLSAGRQGHAAVLPLRVGLRTFGLVAVERGQPGFEVARMAEVDDLLSEQALRLETALLFSEVRTLATTEERRRLAREIHDGIAQELASLGYVVDDLASRAQYIPDLERDIRALRSEMTRVISELRLSIFDLRSDVQTTIGLGTAISDYVRQVGAGSNFTVHLVLDEAPVRLPIDAETELLRIAQEAVTNARKHANAENLWVTCRVDPPSAVLRIEDDGKGLGRPRSDSFGLEVMRERAARIGAKLSVFGREQGGTAVEVTLGSAPGEH
jgi:signal transduction histidine kinase